MRYMEIRSCRQAVVNGLKWLTSQQDSDGSFQPLEHGLNTLHKIPLALALTGQLERGSRLCAWIQEYGLDDEGDFGGQLHREGPLATFYNYGNAFMVMGLHRLGHYGLSLRAAEYLTTLQHPSSGGFLTLGPESALDGMQDMLSAALGGLALLSTGQLAAAEAAGAFLISHFERQPRLVSELLFVQQRGDRLVTEWPEGEGQAFTLHLNGVAQWSFIPGLAGGFLAKLYEVTGERSQLETAQSYIEFADAGGADRYEGPTAWWFGWGAAILYSVTGVGAYRKIAEQVSEQIVDSQMSSGTWAAGSLSHLPPAPLIDATAEAIIVRTEILQAFSMGE
jgi:hypothetical protein